MLPFRCFLIGCSVYCAIGSTIYAEDQKDDLAERFVEYSHNKHKWPLVHYAIEQERPDVAIEALRLFPEQAIMHTPDIKLMESHFGNNAEDDYDYPVGNEQGTSALELAVHKGYIALVQKLLDLGANPSEVRTEYFGGVADYWEPRRQPTVYERVKFVNAFMLNTNYWQRSILYWAVETNNEEMVKLLLQHGASLSGIKAQRSWRIDSPFYIERTSVHQAAHMASDEILKALIAYQQDPTTSESLIINPKVLEIFRTYVNNGSGWPPLHSALKEGNAQAFKSLLECREDLTWQGRAPESLLAMAIKQDDIAFLDMMMSQGLNAYRAMNEAVHQNSIGKVEYLLSFIVPGEESAKILEHAAQAGQKGIVVLLLNHGIRSDHAIELAIETDNLELVHSLITTTQTNFTQLGGLDGAIRRKSVDMVKLLVQMGLQKDRDAQDGLLSLAIKSGNREIFNAVQEAGYRDPGLWEAFVDANAVNMLQDYLQNPTHMLEIQPQLESMKKRALQHSHREMLNYLMALG